MGQVQDPFILFPSNAGIITANQVFDFDADAGTTTDANGLTNWTDQSLNAVGDLFAESAATSPDLIANGNPIGNGNAIDFNGTMNRMRLTGGFTFAQPETIYLVARWDSWTINDTMIDGEVVNALALIQHDATPKMRLFAGSFAADNTDLAVGNWGIISVVFNGANSSIRVNNNTETTGNPGSINANGLTLGSRRNGSSYGAFRICRLIGYDTTAHTDAEQDQNITALNSIYNVF